MPDKLTEAACAYVLARETGRPTTTLYRALRRAWVAHVRAEQMELAERSARSRYVDDCLKAMARGQE